MEIIKKTVLQAVTTGTTSTGVQIIPDLTKSYYFKILLSQDSLDCGFFDAFIDSEEPVVYIFIDSNNDLFTDNNDDIFIM